MRAVRAPVAFDGEVFRPGGATVIIDGERIAGVEAYGVGLPSDCPVIDYDGVLTPGMIDTHSHLCADSGPDALDRVPGYTAAEIEDVVTTALADQLAGGVTTVRDLGDRRFNVTDRRHRDNEPYVVAAGPPITTVGGHCFYLGGEVAGRAAIEAAVAERVEHGVDVIKVMASGGMTTAGTDQLGCQFTDHELRLLVDLAHRAGRPITAHAHSTVAVRQAVRVGVDGIEHCTCLGPRGPIIDPELAAAVATAGIVVCCTVGGDTSQLGPTPPHVLALLDRMGISYEQLFDGLTGVMQQLSAAGVIMVGGIDSGISHIKAHGSIAAGLGAQRAAGLPAASVLAGVTGTAADACGVGDRKGRLQAGGDADLVVLGSDLRYDHAAAADVRAVVLRGQDVTRPKDGSSAMQTG